MENLTLVGTIIAGISIIYNILTKLKNANLTKELLELEDLFAKKWIDRFQGWGEFTGADNAFLWLRRFAPVSHGLAPSAVRLRGRNHHRR